MGAFKIDFSMNRGHEMIIEREPAIRREELDEIEVQMLMNSKIPGMLPMNWSDMDGMITFRYNLAGRKMLSHRLQMQRLSMEQFYTLLLAVVEALGECSHYMLRPEGCMLGDQYLFIGEQLNDIGIAYLPIQEPSAADLLLNGGSSGHGDLLALIVRWTSFVGQLDGEGLQRLLQHFNDKRWPLAELRAELLELLSGPDRLAQASPVKEKVNRTSIGSLRERNEDSEYTDWRARSEDVWNKHIQLEMEPSGSLNDAGGGDSSINGRGFPAAFNEEIIDDTDEAAHTSSIKKQWVFSAVVLVAVAFVWRFLYLPAQSKNSLYISLGLSLIGAAIVVMIWLRSPALSMLSEDGGDDDFIPESGPLAHSWPKIAASEPAVPRDVRKQLHSSPPRIAEPHNEARIAETAVDSQPMRSKADATVLLDHPHVQQEGGLRLYREWEGKREWLDWNGERFTVGRTGEQVDYEDGAAGISRLHLEIECKNGVYQVKDLGSRNGSLLNGQSMIAYKVYPLDSGDGVQLAGANGPKYELVPFNGIE
ncbi:DUF6382 domain-containing protein [Paenibacillus radicis (ex Gao et al. 2016)]|uniref:FHA domain-containing protein n=1 Tax=Paenibacillus radicis (ex Gao et al. 2016) TaxID=1737354 RepID=A0A917M5P5_9BACL|nr:DUF6382 domain-containing protein [Paenibacillus radicis (ex Gao et al. 2016)]GGG76602.1 hypothetical protein GCM10010918_36420 [Paenibacillus radicis (ex Gao et al. 2016)]